MEHNEWIPSDLSPKYPTENTASLLKRLLAGIYDLLISLSFLIFLELAISILPRIDHQKVVAIIFGIFLFLYYIWSIYETGTTQGKKLFKLKLVQHLSSKRPGLTTVVFREVILKPISILSLGLLFFRFKSDAPSISFQDHYTDTRVVVVDESLDGPLEGIAFFSLLPLLIPLASAYTLFCLATPTPLLKINSELGRLGVHIDKIEGNAVKGFKIKNLTFYLKNYYFKMSDLEISLDYKELLLRQNLKISRLNVNTLEVKDWLSQPALPATAKNPYEFASFIAPSGVDISEINFTKFIVNGAEGKSLKLTGAKIRNDGSIQFQNVTGNDINYYPSGKRIKINPSQFVLKKGFFPKLINDLPMSLSAEININDLDSAVINVEIANGQFRLFQNEKSFVLNVTDLEIRQWFHIPWSINKLSLNYYEHVRFSEILKNPNRLLQQDLEVTLQNKKFSLKRNPKAKVTQAAKTITEINCESSLCLHHPDRSFFMQIDLSNLFNDKALKMLRVDEASRNHSYETPIDFLAQVYYNKNFNNLDIEEKRIVAYDSLNLDLNASRVADEQYLSEVRMFAKNKTSASFMNEAGKNILESLKQNRNALNIYKALAYLQAAGDCPQVMAFPSEMYTDMLIQQPKLREPIYKILGLCAKDPQSALTLFSRATVETSPDEETTYHMAVANYKLERWPAALNLFSRLLRFGFSEEAYRYIAHIHQKLGHQREAQFYLARLKPKPTSSENKRNISSEKNRP